MIYRVAFADENGEHYGFEFVGSLSEARKQVLDNEGIGLRGTIQSEPYKCRKKHTLILLNKWASHPE